MFRRPRDPLALSRRAPWLAVLALVSGLELAPADALAFPWNEPERITHNTIEDRTTSESLVHPCFDEAYAVWMQEQAGPGWRIMWAKRDIHGWQEPEPIDTGTFPDFEPRMGLGDYLRAVWQRNSGDAAEIIYAEKADVGDWIIEPITSNDTEDLTPAIPTNALAQAPEPHIVWAGFDPQTQEGKIHHAVRTGSGWEIEVLAGSQLGPFWTGASPRIDVDYNGVVHVVYRGGDFGDYHLHYARKEFGSWTYQILPSLNGNDFSVDVRTLGSGVMVAMSGNDCFGCFTRIYVRRSTNGGLSFGPAELASGSYSASLENLVVGAVGPAIAASEVSGNIYTGNLLYTLVGQPPEILPPADMASESPSAGQGVCIPGADGAGYESTLYINHRNAGPDSAEVYFLASPGLPTAIKEEHATAAGGSGLRLHAAPNPFSTWTKIEIGEGETFAGSVGATVVDASGRLIRRLSPAAGGFLWNGTCEDGRVAPSGIYWVTVKASGRSASRLLVRLR